MRPFFVSVGLLLCVQSAVAQTVTVGAKAGLNSSTYIGPGVQNPRIGFTGGLSAAVAVTGPWSIQAELLYSRKGAQSPDTEMRLHYLEVPLLVRLNTAPIGSLHPVLLAGVAPAIELSCRGRTTEVVQPLIPGTYASGDPAPINCLDYRSQESDLGIVGGVGFETRSKGVTWTMEMRYTEGVADINHYFADRRQHNRSVALVFGVTR